eukprot:Cvel_21664.t1-p1 / transcript=Cvel_21664.t1 / gene=Cvel_21664 / organism=Chromera_velia_CCMP2878 / gene_product=hypothetical protein / transcript_product=hypothetical protein / location=Cvel_scaffold2050:33680-34109(+) / protein_length=143 / sequence_SO=supercontig / SO=protein_coding / is_pseudo=false
MVAEGIKAQMQQVGGPVAPSAAAAAETQTPRRPGGLDLLDPHRPIHQPTSLEQPDYNRFSRFMEWYVVDMEKQLGAANFIWTKPVDCYHPPRSLVLLIKPHHIERYMRLLAYGEENPGKDVKPTLYMTNSLKKLKTNISAHMP